MTAPIYFLLTRPFLTRLTRAGAERASLVALAQLASRAATLQRRFVGTQARASINRKYAFNFSMGPRNNMDTDQFANSTCRRCTRISRCLHGADVAAHEYRYVACADVLLAEQLHIRRFDHRIGGLYCAH